MTQETELKIYNQEESVSSLEFVSSVELTPEYISSLSSENRKALRSELYTFYEDPKDGVYDDIKNYQLLGLDFDKIANKKKSKNYRGDLSWDMEKVENLNTDLGFDKGRFKLLINARKGVSYEELEAVFNGDPKFLVSSMTLIAENYSWAVGEIDRDEYYSKDEFLNHKFKPRFVFTSSEEKMFFTGRTLLTHLYENTGEPKLKALISKIDESIIRFNEGLIGKAIKEYTRSGNPDDLQGEGYIGIQRTLEDFDIDRKKKFSTYTSYWIRRYVERYDKYNTSPIKVPIYMANAIRRFYKAGRSLKKEMEEDPTFDEILEYCEVNNIELPKSKSNLRRAIINNNVLSLDVTIGGEDYSDKDDFHNQVSNEKLSMENAKREIEVRDELKTLIEDAGLTEREARILGLRFGLIPNENKTDKAGHTLDEIGEIEDITRERVRQISKVALRKLRKVSTSE